MELLHTFFGIAARNWWVLAFVFLVRTAPTIFRYIDQKVSR